MKIRAGFVSNSSSTSFLLISKTDLNEADFFELVGVDYNSPIADLFRRFYRAVVESVKTTVDFKKAGSDTPAASWFRDGRLSPHMIEKLEEAKKHGFKAYYGRLDSETDNVQTFFCTDSFEIESDKIYFDGLENVW